MQNKIHHLAIIMDGNGRWAKARGLPRIKGHEAGSKTAKNIVKHARQLDISYITLYAFSSENWNRPEKEVQGLFHLLESFIDTQVGQLHENKVRIHIIGDTQRLSSRLQTKIEKTVEMTRDNNNIDLCLALNYGGRDEIIRAIKRMNQDGIPVDKLSEETLNQHLDTSFMPDPDLLIRTGGEKRISNYLLWQIAYTEIYFSDILWPDFDAKALDQAVEWFGTRERRFGLTSEQIHKKD
ncbi:MAG: isoprenyl transferase [Thermodesulfobacteriota bacterium]|nr:isoprenyl transferase [Thermodesulfobacteriota bacterium]